MLTVQRPFPGITHITDAMGVSFTLIEGRDSALLIDAGYGLEDVRAFVRTLTDKPVKLILTHGHHDHVLGARWFERSLLDPADLDEFRLRTGKAQRQAVLNQAAGKGLTAPEDFLTTAIPLPEVLRYPEEKCVIPCRRFDMGEREAWLLRVPGHTAGSVVLYVPDASLLLTGDDWNPCTWIWFPCSLPVEAWRSNMLHLIETLEKEFARGIRHVLCSHQPALREGTELKEYLAYMTDERLREAPEVSMSGASVSGIRTCQVFRPEKDWVLVFDRDRLDRKEK